MGASFLRTLIALLCAVPAACGGGDDSGDSGPPGRGTPACQDWQDALCDFAADECGVVSRALCDGQAKSIECRSDELASSCSNALQQASCGMPPLGCDTKDIADPAPAIAKCNALLQGACELEIRCGGTRPLDQCLESVSAMLGFSCADALSVDLRYEECVDNLMTVTCDQAVSAIQACTGVIGVLPQ